MQFLGNTVHKKGNEIAQIAQIELALQARVILLVFEEIYSCLFIPNCTRTHVITYTYNEVSSTSSALPRQ